MSWRRLRRVILASVLLFTGPPAAQAFQTCFCAKTDEKLKYCGEIVKFDPDDAITIRIGSAPISLQSPMNS